MRQTLRSGWFEIEREHILAVFVVGLAITTGLGIFVGITEPVAASDHNQTLIVDADGESGNYTSIQPAVNNATDGDTVEVRPGIYREEVRVNKNITLIAPDGATLNGSTLGDRADAFSIPYRSTVAPLISNFTILRYNSGISAYGTHGDWRLNNLTVINTSKVDVMAAASTGAWSMHNTTIKRTETIFAGIAAYRSSGDWVVQNTYITGARVAEINARDTFGDWLLKNVTLTNNSADEGIAAFNSTGDWTIVNSSITNNEVGVRARYSEGNWTIQSTLIKNNSNDGVQARGTFGYWEIHESEFVNNNRGLIARDAQVKADATRNWWGASDGPSGDFSGSGQKVRGNVTVKPFYTDANLTTLSEDSTTCIADSVSGDDNTIGLTEIQTAINWWAEGTKVPDTRGETISLSKIQSLINAWAEDTPVSCS